MSLKTQNGLVGYFDVLGYQNIIDNNKIADAARILSESLLKIPEAAKRSLETTPDMKDLLGKVNWLMLSDSIILTMSSESVDQDEFAWFIFLGFASRLLRESFDNGFPMRGAVDVGEYYVEDRSFAGKPFVNSYRLAYQIEFSGCVLTDNAAKEIEKIKQSETLFGSLFFRYLVPLKNNRTERRLVLNWLRPFSDWGEHPNNLREYVIGSFHAHNKDISPEVIQKIDNTEMLLHCLKGKS